MLEHGQGVGDDVVGFLALDMRDEAHAARVMLELRIVKSLFGWEPRLFAGGWLQVRKTSESGDADSFPSNSFSAQRGIRRAISSHVF